MQFRLWLEQNDPMESPDFRGFHCSKYEKPDGRIVASYFTQSQWGNWILEHIPYNLTDKLYDLGIQEPPNNDKYSGEYEEWAEKMEEFLWDNGIRWVFVSKSEPFGSDRWGMGGSYGSNCFFVIMPEQDMLGWDIDIQETHAEVIMYRADKPPQFIPIPDDWEIPDDYEPY